MYTDTYLERKALGLCVSCGKKADNGVVVCKEHREYRKVRYQGKLNAGHCPYGNCSTPPEDGIYCNKHKIYITKMKRNLRNLRKAEGLCIHCGKPAVHGLTECYECKDRVRDKAQQNLAQGLCRCGKKPSKDFQTCKRCRK